MEVGAAETSPSLLRRRLARVPLVGLGVLALLGALAGGLVRLGWPLPAAPTLVVFHGPLMVAGFLGTVIGLERAVALARPWAYVAPVASGLGALALMIGMPGGPWLLALGSAAMVAVFVAIVARQAASFTVVMGLGAVSWLGGQILWLAGWPIHRLVFWWGSFLVLTIAGERLELTRLIRRPPASRAVFAAGTALLLAGLVSTTVAGDGGARTIGVAWIVLAAWLGTADVARRTIRARGLPRYIATALLSGYVWLAVAGLFAVRWGALAAGPLYDAMLHALFVGFVFSLIFGHAPIIVPALLGRPVAYRPTFYLHVGLLHASLALRVIGDFGPWLPGRRWGGLLNALAIVLFFVNIARGALAGRTTS
jgi:hypothetical protein